MIKRIIQYETGEGKCPFREWFLSLKDATVRAKIRSRLDRILLGSFGDCKSIGGGVFELRFHFGSGYRVYFGIDQNTIVILLYGGDKHAQERDIHRSQEYWKDYIRRNR